MRLADPPLSAAGLSSATGFSNASAMSERYGLRVYLGAVEGSRPDFHSVAFTLDASQPDLVLALTIYREGTGALSRKCKADMGTRRWPAAPIP